MRDKVLIFRTSLYLDAQVRYTHSFYRGERKEKEKKKKAISNWLMAVIVSLLFDDDISDERAKREI